LDLALNNVFWNQINFKNQMKKLFIILLLFVSAHHLSAQTHYYISSSAGNDNNNGTSNLTPWKTLSKLNAAAITAGSEVSLKRGDVFYGTLTFSHSGGATTNIIYDTYGSGANPVLTGYTTQTTWTNEGGGIYSTPVSTSSSIISVVRINGQIYQRGRYPNTGYFTYQTHSGNSQITSSDLDGVINWTGAEVVLRKVTWILDRYQITAQSGSTLTFSTTPVQGSSDTYAPHDGTGFFIQNDLRTLDQFGEWYWNNSTKKLYVYFGTNSPINYTVEAATIDNNIYVGANYITVKDITITGSNLQGMFFNWPNHITLNGVTSLDQGGYFINGGGVSYGSFDNLHVTNSMAGGIRLPSVSYTHINNSFINGSGMWNGNLYNGDGVGEGGMHLTGDNDTAMNNTVLYSGYHGMDFRGSNLLVQHNFVDNFCSIKDDGGGIYVSSDAPKNVKILNNIIGDGIGAFDGFPDTHDPGANGIYCDDASNDVTVSGNTIFNCVRGGIYQHNCHDNIVTNNTLYNDALGLYLSAGYGSTIYNITQTGNIMVATNLSQLAYALIYTDASPISTLGAADNNYFMRVADTSTHIRAEYIFNQGANGQTTFYNLPQWKTFTSQNANSSTGPKYISKSDSLKFVYNPTDHDSTIALAYNYEDAKGVQYNGTITLHSFESAVLIQNGTATNTFVAPPTISISGSQSITVNSTSVFAVATPASEQTITGYHWTIVSGSATIASPNSANTDVTGLPSGKTVLQCSASQSDGQTVTGTVTINVTLPIAPPTANAGNDQTIILPTSSATLSGSGTAANGQTITGYIWTKISGNGVQSFSSNTSTTPTVFGMSTSGDYIFQLQVNQSDGQSATKQVKVTVQDAPPPSPAAVINKWQTRLKFKNTNEN
jgi:parallel beta-helix repeat protein